MTTTPPSADSRAGKAPDSHELLIASLAAAGLTRTSLEDAAALRDETRRVLAELIGVRNEVRHAAAAVNAQIRQVLAPDLIYRAGDAGQKAIEDFRKAAATTFADLRANSEVIAGNFWMRTAGFGTIGVILLSAFVGFWAWHVPSLDEVQARRAEMRGAEIFVHKGQTWAVLLEPQRCDSGTPAKCVGRLK